MRALFTSLIFITICGEMLASSRIQQNELPNREDHRSSSQTTREFRSARFNSVRFGLSKKTEIINIYGKPKYYSVGEDGMTYLSYKNIWQAKGDVEFAIDPRTGIVDRMVVYPDKKTARDIVSILGKKHITSRWAMATCEEYDGDSIPIYRDPNGEIVTLEYTESGIVVLLDGERARYVAYLGAPFGFDKNPCDARQKGAMKSKQGK